MAIGKASRRRRRWPRRALIAVVPLTALFWVFHDDISGYSAVATAYGARLACSCRHVDGLSLRQCRADFEDPRMRLVMLSEDEDALSVTARIPLLHTQTATYRKGWGCNLQPWSR